MSTSTPTAIAADGITAASPDSSHSIDWCNRLLRGELSAVETYEQAINKFEGEPQLETLERIKDEHVKSANFLSAMAEQLGGEADDSAGAWGLFAKAVQGAANLLGEESAINSLLQGEQHGHGEYLAAQSDEQLSEDCRQLITTRMIPLTVEHIATLAELGETV